MEPFPFFIPELEHEIGSRAEIDPHTHSGLLFSGPAPYTALLIKRAKPGTGR